MPKEKTKNTDHGSSVRILIGLTVGVAGGIALNLWGPNPTREWVLKNFIDPVGQVFLRCLFMVVVPLIFSSLVVGVANLGKTGSLKRLGSRLGIYYVFTVVVAILTGQFLVTFFKPGAGVSTEFIEHARNGLAGQVSDLMKSSSTAMESLWPGLVTAVIPKNILYSMAHGEMLALIFISILTGVALLRVKREQAEILFQALEAVSDASIVVVGWVMHLAPFAVAALVASAVSKFGTEILGNVAKYMAVVVLGYCIHFFITYALLLKYVIRVPVLEFYRRGMPVFLTAFGTSSSNATIPTTIQTLESRFGLPSAITTFVIPLGATVNMDGTALMEMVAAMFIAQVFGVPIDTTAQVTLVLLIFFTSMGVGGIPGGSIPLLMSVMALVGIPAEGIALILGVDRLLDMGRTVLNVTGDMMGALFLARIEGLPISGADDRSSGRKLVPSRRRA